MFGEQRILEEADRVLQASQISPKALIDRMTQAVHAFVGDYEQSDDLTMMAIRRNQ
jgi:sigma-B regulation protein RsbU (phosphoserine phosphatase)